MEAIIKDPRQWGLKTEHISTVPRSTVPVEYITFNESISPSNAPESSVAPSIIEPNPAQEQPPSSYLYPKGRTLHRRGTEKYRARCVYAFPYHPPLDASTEVDYLRRVILPPHSYPTDNEYDHVSQSYHPKPIEGLTPLPPGVPVCVDLDGKEEDSVTIATLFDLESLKRFPEYDDINRSAMKLWDITWGNKRDGRPAVFELEMQRNMRSGAKKEERPFDGSSSQASTRLEGNGRGFGIPASQTDASQSYGIRLSFLQTLNELYQLMAPLAMSKEEYLATTFRAVDLNIFSFGGLFPTGLTSVQLNSSSGDEGGDLMAFIGAIQGAFHVDFHDDRTRWTMLVILIRLPPGSDPGAFILARFGLYAKLKLMPDGRCMVFLWFKGNDLHSGVAPTVHPSVRRAALAELAEHVNKEDRVNRVVYVCYPSEDLCHRRVPMMRYPDSFNSAGPSSNFHWYITQGSPALGSKRDTAVRLWWDDAMEFWNHALARGEKPEFPPCKKLKEGSDEHGEKTLIADEYPLPTFPFLEHGALQRNPHDNPDFFGLWRGLWKRHINLSERYYLSMTKFQYRFGQDQARLEYEENHANGAFVMANLAESAVENSNQASLSSQVPNPLPSYPAHRPERQKRKDFPEPELVPDHPSKRLRTNTEPPSSRSTPQVQQTSPETTPSPHVAATAIDDTATQARRMYDPEGESETEENEEDNLEEEMEIPLSDISFIVDSEREDDGTLYYKVRWTQRSAEDDSWRKASQLSRARDLITDYEYRLRTSTEIVTHKKPAYNSLLKMFASVPELTEDLERLRELKTALTLGSQPSDDVAGIIRTGHLLRQVPIQLDSHTSFTRGIIETVIPILSTTAATIIKTVEGFALNQAIGRAFLFVYSWYTDYGPHLVKTLLSASASSLLKESYPQYYPLVHHLMNCARQLKDKLATRGMTFKRLQDKESSLLTVVFPLESITPLFPNAATPLSVTLPAMNARNPPALEDWLRQPLLDFLSEHLVVAPTKASSAAKPAVTQSTASLQHMGVHEWVIRGALADALVDVFDDDSVLGLDLVHSAFNFPNAFFEQPSNRGKPKPIFHRICQTPDETTENARCWLRQQPWLPETQSCTRDYGRTVHEIIELLTKRPVKAGSRSTSRKRKAKVVDFVGTLVDPQTPFAQLIPYKERPNFAFLSIMLREVLAFARGEKHKVNFLRRILACEDLKTGTSKQSLNPDHYSPVRFSTHFQTLISKSISSGLHLLTSQYGLSNILLRFATGQGYRTRRFLEEHLSQWFTEASEVVSVFEHARQSSTTSREHSLYSDGRCWGQHSKQLTFDPKKPIEDRIAPLFSSEVYDAWRTYWGVYYGVDHRKLETSCLPQYTDVFKLLDRLKISGFGPGSVTRMQLANFFAIEGLCQQPSADTMAEITAMNQKGALQGLLILGFNVRNAKLDVIGCAFRCVYDFLDEHLTPVDKDVLGFDAIFVEHLLCKITRWHNMITRAQLLAEVERLLENAKKGTDGWRQEGFPLPLSVDREALLVLVETNKSRARSSPYNCT
ncbi:hypothetical protein V5O48_013731 [Marasmius crinis-equi]|uniref:Chromo domain-containing protein n=1 Tax=Marasmius crinis-equi TaxID=585013 RepID=A0ABR3EZC4_9AGAR